MAKTTRLDLFVRPTSTVTKQGAIDYAYQWANDRTNHETNIDENGDKINAYYVDITDSRNGMKFMVFGDLSQVEIGVPKVLDILDKEEFAPVSVVETVNTQAEAISTQSQQIDANTQAIADLQDSSGVDAVVV